MNVYRIPQKVLLIPCCFSNCRQALKFKKKGLWAMTRHCSNTTFKQRHENGFEVISELLRSVNDFKVINLCNWTHLVIQRTLLLYPLDIICKRSLLFHLGMCLFHRVNIFQTLNMFPLDNQLLTSNGVSKWCLDFEEKNKAN